MANGNKFDTQLAEFCLIMGEQIMILENELGYKAFTHDWDIDRQIVKFTEQAYEEWLLSNSHYTSATEFIKNKLKSQQDIHEINTSKQVNGLLAKMINREPKFGDMVSIEVKDCYDKNRVIRENVVFDGSRWVDVGLTI